MKYNVLGSSSKGNCIIVEDSLMLDCGISFSKIKPYLNKVKIIFISHVHKDHFLPSTIKKIVYEKPNMLFITGSSDVVRKLYEIKGNADNIIYADNTNWWHLGLFKVKLEPLYHDVFNYALKWEYKDKFGLYAVDTSRIDHIEAKNYDLYLIEANYQEELLQRHIDECQEEGDLVYLKRVTRTHLSDNQANSFLIENMGDKSKYQYIHQSSYNYEEENNE